MHTILDTLDGRKLLTVLDTGTQVCVVPISVVEALQYSYNKESDITLSSADDMTTEPIGVCPEFKFKLSDFTYTVKAYVVRKASFQLLLGNEFLWSVGAALFPRWGAFAVTYPAVAMIKASCKKVDSATAPPPLHIQEKRMQHPSVDATSGLQLETKKETVSFSFFDVREKEVPCLKVSASCNVISIGERDYVKDAEPDNDTPNVTPMQNPPLFTDTYVRSRVDINPAAPNWFKDAMIGAIMRYHEAIS
jgi:hypothetical protein